MSGPGALGPDVVAALLHPTFVEVRGCVLLSDREASLAAWWEHLDGDIPAIEAVINHVHLWDAFDDDELATVDDDDLAALLTRIAEAWRARLADAYPDRTFEVWATTDEDVDYGPTVGFRSVPPDGGPPPA